MTYALCCRELLVRTVGIRRYDADNAPGFVFYQLFGHMLEIHVRAFGLNVLEKRFEQIDFRNETEAEISIVRIVVDAVRSARFLRR